jgi:hypothetical protein
MGSITFLLPDPLPPAAQATLGKACFASGGPDQAPVPAKVVLAPGALTITRSLSESGYLLAPWPIGSLGAMVVSTSTLRDASEPYRLLIELTRGKLNQVRTQAAEWELIGLRHRADFEANLADTTRLFGKALLASSPAESDAQAARALEQSFFLADSLVREFISQMFDTRHHEEGLLDTRLAARVGGRPGEFQPEYGRAFNAAQIALNWRTIEPEESRYDWAGMDEAVAAAKAAGLPLTAGPVIDLSPGMLPDWAAGWETDLPTLAAFMCDFLETAIGRYKGDIRRWVVCGGFNQSNSFGLDDDDRIRLAYRLFEAAATVDPGLELIINIAQPWGDYLVDDEHTISPLTFPDDLMRAGVNLSAVELEIRPGLVPRGSLPRDLLDTVRLFHLYSHLGLPLEVVLSRPSAYEDDALASHAQSIWSPAGNPQLTLEGQAEWGASLAALALCTPQVRAVTWDHWSDRSPHLVPAGGLLDRKGIAKPLLSRLRTLRTAHLR